MGRDPPERPQNKAQTRFGGARSRGPFGPRDSTRPRPPSGRGPPQVTLRRRSNNGEADAQQKRIFRRLDSNDVMFHGAFLGANNMDSVIANFVTSRIAG